MDQTMAGPGMFFGLFGLAMMLLYVLVMVIVLLSLWRGMKAQEAIAERLAGIERALTDRRDGLLA
jgi:uncharacterized membrane protein